MQNLTAAGRDTWISVALAVPVYTFPFQVVSLVLILILASIPTVKN